jgi:hypothetical protein
VQIVIDWWTRALTGRYGLDASYSVNDGRWILGPGETAPELVLSEVAANEGRTARDG